MLTKDDIRKKREENPDWEPTPDAPQEVWERFYAVVDEDEDGMGDDDEWPDSSSDSDDDDY